ncbi:hypothetical protein [Planctellipticum variicoloris]|uniref:hypothetical protein n=1 Tax=Planctellipticum variicoloris TaxID=3064265 RepID=UPI003013E509|nr:hypothetical protein SH412_005598 [Planctomycetaceae bacterium SH412]
MTRTLATLCFAAVCAALLAGCGGSGLKLENLHGKVTFGGQPIVYGLIEFIPNAAADHKGPAGSAEIVNGEYDTKNSGRGVVRGPHLVRISAFEERPQPSSEDETKPTVNKPPIFSGYTIETEVAAGEQNFEVPESAKGFDLMKQNKVKPQLNVP